MDSKSQVFYPFSCTLGRTIPEPNFEFQALTTSSTASTIQIVQSNGMDTLSFLENGGQDMKPRPCCWGIIWQGLAMATESPTTVTSPTISSPDLSFTNLTSVILLFSYVVFCFKNPLILLIEGEYFYLTQRGLRFWITDQTN